MSELWLSVDEITAHLGVNPERIDAYKGRINDPACGSCGIFMQSDNFVESHAGKLGDISIYRQESNATTPTRPAVMNLALRGINADFVLANHTFNDSDPAARDTALLKSEAKMQDGSAVKHNFSKDDAPLWQQCGKSQTAKRSPLDKRRGVHLMGVPRQIPHRDTARTVLPLKNTMPSNF